MRRLLMTLGCAAAVFAPGVSSAQSGVLGNWYASFEDGRRLAFMEGSGGARLTVACSRRDVLIAFLTFPFPLTIDDQIAVRVRIGDEPVQAQRWEVFGNRDQIAPPASVAIGPWIQRLAKGRRLAVEVGGSLQAFDLEGITQVNLLLGDCSQR